MRRTATLSTCIALACLASAALAAPAPADLVILDADVRTQDSAAPAASAVAVKRGRIAWIGASADANAWIGPKTTVLRAEGRTVLPGLVDSHIHTAEGALARGGCSIADEQLPVEEVGKKIRECFANDSSSKWLVVTDVNGAGFKADRKALDAIENQRPLFLWGADGHTAWANSRALELAKITRDTPNPDDGRIERDAAGEATGFLVDAAVNLVSNLLDKPTPERRREVILRTLPQLHAAGITTYFEANTDAETVAAYAALAQAKQLSARVTIALESAGEASAAEFARLEKLRASIKPSPLLRVDFIKLFADGVMEFPTQSAGMLEPFLQANGRPGTSRGKLYLTPDEMNGFVKLADKHGFNVHIHAIGDGATRESLDAVAAARAAGSKRLYSICHLQLVDRADMPRFKQLDVIASLQLLWAEPDNYTLDAVLPWIGTERAARMYPARSLVAAGATIAGGSDWDVSSFNPFEAMATAISRTNPKLPTLGQLNPAEALTLDEMLAAYTLGGAKMMGRDGDIGSLTVGKAADIILLDRKYTSATTADEVRGTKVTHAWRDGVALPLAAP
jgi:predicted amidohydrolase YtcJ